MDQTYDELNEIIAAHALLRHSHPREVEDKMLKLIALNPPIRDSLFRTVDIPFKIITDQDTNLQFIGCEFNRDADCYRSPYTNIYEPELPDGRRPSDRLRQMELLAQHAFDQPNPLFPPKSLSSIYCWDIDKDIFGFGLFSQFQVYLEKEKVRTIYGTFQRSHVIKVTKISKDPVKKSKFQTPKAPTFEYQLFSSGRLDLSVPLNPNSEVAPQDTIVITVPDEHDEDEMRNEVITIINENYVDRINTQDYIFLDGYATYTNKKIADAETDVDHLVNLFKFIEDENDNLVYEVRNEYCRKMREIFREYKFRS